MKNPTGMAASLRLDARKLHHLGPLLCLFGDEFCELAGRTDERDGAEVGKPPSNPRISETRVDLLVECVDDLDGRRLGGADAAPTARLEARHGFADCRDLRQNVKALAS